MTAHGSYTHFLITGCRCADCSAARDWALVSARGSLVDKLGHDFPAVGVAVWVGVVTA